jgi:hypothetical protein
MPLVFDSKSQEINFISLLQLLNFGSGYRKELHEITGRGAYDTMCFGLMNAHISGINMDTLFMKEVDVQTIASLFQLPLLEHNRSAISDTSVVSARSNLRYLAEQIRDVLIDTGLILERHGYNDMSDLVFHLCQEEEPASAANLVKSLAELIPAFSDITTSLRGKRIFILKKAQLLAAELYRRFHTEDVRFNFEDIDDLTIFADNVVPAVLRELGILIYDESLASRVDQEGLLRKDERLDLQLRAASISACEQILQTMRDSLIPRVDATRSRIPRAMDLDFYLWTMGKQPSYRSIKRHRTQDTVFY